MPYELTDRSTTADAGLTATGSSLEELFADSAIGLMQIMTEVNELEEKDSLSFEIEEDTTEELYYRWLSDIIYYKDAEDLLVKKCRIELVENDRLKLKATIIGEKINPEKHTLKVDVKAVTYYRFKVEKENDNWHSEVVFDL